MKAKKIVTITSLSPELELYEAADEYALLLNNAGTQADLAGARVLLKRAARAFVQGERDFSAGVVRKRVVISQVKRI